MAKMVENTKWNRHSPARSSALHIIQKDDISVSPSSADYPSLNLVIIRALSNMVRPSAILAPTLADEWHARRRPWATRINSVQ